MKINVGRQQEYRSWNLILTITSEEEARAIYAIFNHSNNTQLLNYGVDEEIKRNILAFDSKANETVKVTGEIAQGIEYTKFYG